MAGVSFRDVKKNYGDLEVIHGVTTDVADGEFVVIVGSDAANEWNLIMATAILAMLPPALVVLLMQKWFVKGLVETEK